VTMRVCLKFTLHTTRRELLSNGLWASPMPATVTIVFSAAKFSDSESRPSITRGPIIQAEAVTPGSPIKSQPCAVCLLRSSPRILVDNMSSQSTPPNSQHVSTGNVLSKTTPLKRDIHGTQAHSSSPYQGALARYLEMTRDACEKFVGPMPVDKFLSDFIPQAREERPTNEIMFLHSSVSEHEDEFVSLNILKGISTLNPVTDQRNQGIGSLSQTQV